MMISFILPDLWSFTALWNEASRCIKIVPCRFHPLHSKEEKLTLVLRNLEGETAEAPERDRALPPLLYRIRIMFKRAKM